MQSKLMVYSVTSKVSVYISVNSTR